MFVRLAPLLLILLAACGRSERPAASAPARPITAPTGRETAQCHVDLNREGARFSILPDRDFGGGCGIVGTVQLIDIGVPVTSLKAVRCGQALAFTRWVRNAVAPAAFQILGSELVRVDSMGSYACRNVVGSARAASRRSGHAIANAIDIAGFTLRDGRRVSILADWKSPDPKVRRFVETVHASACRRFGTVLSPDYNAAHRNHLHLEDDRASFCR
jgi:hypothetical protein